MKGAVWLFLSLISMTNEANGLATLLQGGLVKQVPRGAGAAYWGPGDQHDLESTHPAAVPAHVRNGFQFIVKAPLRRTAPLFGPEGERCWAGEHWNPEFLYPQPGKDVHGSVFTIQHGAHRSVWVNTLFDPEGGRMQYVSFVPDTLVSTVDVRLSVIDRLSTLVEVTYARTALDVAANDHVQAMGRSDRESGPQWQQAIESCLNESKISR